ncbi:MAG: PEP-CTERM sorting domain-containing protein [Phycisphaerae bacterium]
MFKSNSILLAACGGSALLALSCGSVANASVIYQDSFARSGNLAGTTPAPTDTGGVTWGTSINGGMTAKTNGSELVLAQASGQYGVGNGYLTYTPPASGTITLSAGLTKGSGGWGILGFESTTSGDNASGSSKFPAGPNVMLLGNYVMMNPVAQSGTGTAYQDIPGFVSGSPTVLTITYDISTETAQWYSQTGTNSPSLLYTYDYATNGVTAPTIAAVEVGMWASSSTSPPAVVDVQNFTLTAVPEPASLGLVAVGALGLLLLKRRRKA